jgi:hypothetical protein
VVLASIVVCAAVCLLFGVHRRRTRRTDAGQDLWPAPIAGPQPAMIGRPVAAGTPMVTGAPMAVGAPAPASSPLSVTPVSVTPVSAEARRKRNSGASHFSRPRANTRTVARAGTLPRPPG